MTKPVPTNNRVRMVQFGVDEEGQNPSKNACGSRATVALRKETADN